MPQFDGTGPQGKGPLTGRGRGTCVPRKGAGPQRRRFGYGRLNRCMGWLGICPRMPLQDSDTLEEAEKALEEELKAVRKELESKDNK